MSSGERAGCEVRATERRVSPVVAIPGLMAAAIEEAGYAYGSSVYRSKHGHCGVPDAPRFPHRGGGWTRRIPSPPVRRFGLNWPVGGETTSICCYPRYRLGGSARSARKIANRRSSISTMKLIPDNLLCVRASAKTRFRHYVKYSPIPKRVLRRLLRTSPGKDGRSVSAGGKQRFQHKVSSMVSAVKELRFFHARG